MLSCGPTAAPAHALPKPTPIYPDLADFGRFLDTFLNSTVSVIRSTNLPDPVVEHQPTCSDSQQPEHSSKLPKCGPPKIKKEPGSHKSSPNRLSYPREFKLMVINHYYAHGSNKYRTCKQFQITKSMLNGWLQKAEKIRQSRPGSMKSGRSGRKPQFPNVEEKLYQIYLANSELGKLNNKWLRETAKRLAKEEGSDNGADGICQFSERWLHNFKKRYGLVGAKECSGSCSSETTEQSDLFSDNDSDVEVNVEDVDEDMPSPLMGVPSFEYGEIAMQILNQPGRLPIQAFYDKFPGLAKRTFGRA